MMGGFWMHRYCPEGSYFDTVLGYYQDELTALRAFVADPRGSVKYVPWGKVKQ